MSMNEITHASARKLLQLAVDQPLSTTDRDSLEAHLAGCNVCREYAHQLTDLGNSLHRLMHAKWDAYRPALSLPAILHPSPAKVLWNSLFNQTQMFGKATVIAALLLGYFVIANLVGIRGPLINEETPTVLPTPNGLVVNSDSSPTPSIQTVHTGVTLQTCVPVPYVVQENDTLEGIALRHGTTKEEILAFNPGNNSLTANTIFTGTEILIPLCEGTPSHTASVPSNTLTITPLNATTFPE